MPARRAAWRLPGQHRIGFRPHSHQGGAGWTKEEVGRVLKVDRTSGQVIVELDMANCWRDYVDKDVGARDGTWKGLEDALRERIVAEICDHGQINGRVAIDVRLNGR